MVFQINVNYDVGNLNLLRDAYLEALDKGLNDAAKEFLKISASAIDDNELVDRGTLKQSGNMDIDDKLNKYVFYTAEHAPFVEFGSSPHWAPFEPLLDYTKRKMFPQGSPKEQRAMAKWLQRHIAENGTMPHPFFRPSVNEIRERMNSFIEPHIKKAVTKHNRDARRGGAT